MAQVPWRFRLAHCEIHLETEDTLAAQVVSLATNMGPQVALLIDGAGIYFKSKKQLDEFLIAVVSARQEWKRPKQSAGTDND